MEIGPKCNEATPRILIICVISILIFHTDCSYTERIQCESKLCEHGICYRTTKSITVGGEIDSYTMQCPVGFDKFNKFCFKLTRDKHSWFEVNVYSENNGSLATLFEKEDVNTVGEYLRFKISDDHAPAWVNLILDNISDSPSNQQLCTALEPTNYTRWKIRDCDSELYSIRTHNLSNPTPTFDIMCQCHPGYTGRSCDNIDSKLSTQETTNPGMLQCPMNTVIFVEFALDGYEAKDTTGLDSFATSTLAILRAWCQGKNKCSTASFHDSSVLYNKPPQATLTVRHSCVNPSDMYCPSSTFRIEDDERVICILPMYRNVLWNAAVYYCFQKGGYLASFNNEMDRVNFSAISRMLKPLAYFWTLDYPPDSRSRNTWAMAIRNHQYDRHYALVPTENSELLPGICVIPPLYQASNKTNTAMKIALHNTIFVSAICLATWIIFSIN